jgi:hypothetical protein
MATHWTGTMDHALIDQAMPTPDYLITEQLVLPVPPEEAFDAISTFDLADVRQPAVRAAVRLGRLPGQLLRRRPTRLTLDNLVTGTNWLMLGRRPGKDIVLGAVGQFWTPVVRWKPITPDEFAEFHAPAWAKIVVGFTVLPYGDHRSMVAHEARITFYDRGTQKTFTTFWWLVRPLVRIALRAMLHTIRDTAIAAERS